ncbi:Chemotaxis response regulator protein-glutamate methylesterase [Propionispora sp. 2/2-37]|uniref:protein-glutamate methylesterase/protein-glutamine glutaminase n=1 Tax=Propionispora sp. 2/2-37 TaxID=1677858 RepID=UPI0006BB6C29|nr:chemotaxis response regulator protein-glutamate methylesterase [Propionispora sp. 2/2-37]CUH96108.1 Chemotaxis response regulator protein-glutamate methylesterase [Propionispora sp. 2/2-37]
MIKILIVEDSAFMRKLLTDVFSAESDFSVLDTARNGKDAVEKVKRLKPDLVTMDVEMPVMDGLTALEMIMREVPTPVVMISSLTKSGAEATLRALELGAVDFVAKTSGPISSVTGIRAEIVKKCRAAVKANVAQLTKSHMITAPLQLIAANNNLAAAKPTVYPAGQPECVVAIGTSTGGPRALQEIITKLPGNLPCGVVVVQHMPPGFTKSLAERLNSLSSLTVKEAEQNDPIRPGVALVAPGDYHMTVESEGNRKIVKLSQKPPIGGHRPAVDPMMESVAKVYGGRAVGVILTGMGHDGAQGMKAIKKQGGYTVAEDQSTSVVFGMPKAAIELGIIDKVLPLPAIAPEIVKSLSK